MAKRRTKKQKLSAKHTFAVSWKPTKENKPDSKGLFTALPRRSLNKNTEAENTPSEANVKRQFKSSRNEKTSKREEELRPILSDKSGRLGTIKKDITKSLILAGIIIASEIMLYLFLPR